MLRRTYASIARSSRGHIRRVKPSVVPPKPPVSRKSNFQPLQRKTVDIKSEIDKYIAENANVEQHWMEVLNKSNGLNKDRVIKEFLSKIIGYSEREKSEELSYSVEELLLKQVIKYDTMYGPNEFDEEEKRGSYPEEIREGLIQCREGEDALSMLKLYDIYFSLLSKSLVVKNIERREEVIREIGISGDYDNGIEKLVDEVEKNGDVSLIREIEEKWYEIEKPRNLNIYYSGYNRILKLMSADGGDKMLVEFDGKFVDEFIKDLIVSDIGLEYDEINIMIKNIIRFQKFNEEIYVAIKKEIEESFGMKVSLDNYLNFLNGALMNNEFQLCEKILEDVNSDGFVLDRKFVHFLMNYYGKREDADRLIGLVEFMMKGLQMSLFAPDWEILMDNLIRVGYRSVSVDILKSLVIVQQGCCDGKREESVELDIGYEDRVRDLEIFNSSTGSYSGDIVVTVPQMTTGMVRGVFATCRSVAEFDQLHAVVDGPLNCAALRSAEMLKVELLVKHRCGHYGGADGRENFKRRLVEALNTMPMREIDRMAHDRETVAVVASMAGEWVDNGCGVDDDDDVMRAYGQLLSHQTAKSTSQSGMLAPMLAVAGISV